VSAAQPVIVCGTDFTDASRAATDVAAHLAALLGASLQLVHVREVDRLAGGDVEAAERVRAGLLEEELGRVRRGGAVETAARLLRGDAATELARVAADTGAMLIVVAAIGPATSIFRVGGTAERVAQAARAPVLLVREPARLLRWSADRPLPLVALIAEDAASDRVVEWLRWLRIAGPCDITALQAYYVDDAVRRYGLSRRAFVEADPEIEGYVRRDLRDRIEPLAGDGDLVVDAVLAHGRLADHLIDHPAVNDAALVVVGNHRARGLARLSSVAAGVVQVAPMSLLVVPVDAPDVAVTPWPEIRRVVVATDFSKFAAVAIRHAFGLLAHAGGELTLVHVREADGRRDDDEAVRASLRALARRGPPSVTTSCVVVDADDVAAALDQAAARAGADCIVIASRGRGGIAGVVLGSVAREVVHRAHRPVLVVRPPADL
jgi:nucleotide-binding universal stress UspA family protein